MKNFLIALLILSVLPISGFSYGQRGHMLVGAVADLRLTTNKQAAAKVAELLAGLSLAEAANLADSIKGWDDCRGTAGTFTVAGGPRIDKELHDLIRANPCDGKPNHHQF